MKLEHIGGVLFVASAAVFLGSMAISSLQQYNRWAEYGAIAGAGIWVIGKVT